MAAGVFSVPLVEEAYAAVAVAFADINTRYRIAEMLGSMFVSIVAVCCDQRFRLVFIESEMLLYNSVLIPVCAVCRVLVIDSEGHINRVVIIAVPDIVHIEINYRAGLIRILLIVIVALWEARDRMFCPVKCVVLQNSYAYRRNLDFLS